MFDKLRATLREKLPFPKLRAPVREWRQSRPFLAGILVMIGGAVIILYPLAPLPVLLEIGMTAILGVALGLVLIVGGLFFWFTPGNRVFVSIVTAIASVASLVVSNLGGFVVGMMAGIIGSCLAFGWTPDKQRRDDRKPPGKPQPKSAPGETGREKAAADSKSGPARHTKVDDEPLVDPHAKPQHPWPTTEPGAGQRPYRR